MRFLSWSGARTTRRSAAAALLVGLPGLVISRPTHLLAPLPRSRGAGSQRQRQAHGRRHGRQLGPTLLPPAAGRVPRAHPAGRGRRAEMSLEKSKDKQSILASLEQGQTELAEAEGQEPIHVTLASDPLTGVMFVKFVLLEGCILAEGGCQTQSIDGVKQLRAPWFHTQFPLQGGLSETEGGTGRGQPPAKASTSGQVCGPRAASLARFVVHARHPAVEVEAGVGQPPTEGRRRQNPSRTSTK